MFIKLITSLILPILFFNNIVQAAINEDSVMKVRARYSEVDFEDVPSYDSYDDLMEAFLYIRDTRFLSYEGEKRKIPWLFIKDFCQLRAHHAIKELEKAGFKKPKKVFIHGILDLRNEYFQLKPGEMIWQHIAPIVKVDGVKYILDPSINREKPLRLDQWIRSMTNQQDKALFAVCDGDTYIQTSSCFRPQNSSKQEELVKADTYWSLRLEWNTIKYHGHDPAEVLLK